MKEYILKNPIISSISIFIICLAVRLIEYFIIKTDETIFFENFIHKLVGIIILLVVLKIVDYKLEDIGFKKNNFLKYLLYGLSLGLICFGISYLIECLILYTNSKNPTPQIYVNGFNLIGSEVKHTECIYFIMCILFNIVNVIMEEGIFRGLFLKIINNKYSFFVSNIIVALLFGIWHFVMPLKLYLYGDINLISLIIMTLGYIILAGVMSIKWGMTYKMTGSLLIGIGDHLFNNTIATNMLHIVTNTGIDELQIVRVLIAQIVSFGLICLIYNKMKRNNIYSAQEEHQLKRYKNIHFMI